MEKNSYGNIVLADNFIAFFVFSVLNILLTPVQLLFAVFGQSIGLNSDNGAVAGGSF